MTEGETRLPWRPWRSSAAAWVATCLVLLAGLPLFLAMPPWCDVTLYQMAARNVLNGGTHYRDIFDTNLPGFVWLMAVCKLAFGWNYEALRAVDLCVIGGSVAVLCGWVWRCGGTTSTVAWLVASVAMFYPFTSEFNHIQRDPWMLLPAAIAARLRVGRVWREGNPSPTPPLRREGLQTPAPPPIVGEGVGGPASLLEGFLWGVAVWLKPHVVFPAFAVWAVSAVFLARREPRRRVLADLAGLIAGGLLAAAPGVVWLVTTGAWTHFLDIFLNWNPAYLSDSGSVSGRFATVFDCFRPWSLLQYPALALAILSLWEARVWSRTPGAPATVPRPRRWYLPAESERVASARALLAAFYLGWMAQAVLIQKAFDYVHVPLLVLGFAVVASHRWAFGFAYLVWFVAVGILLTVAEQYPATAPTIHAIDPNNSRVKFDKHPLANAEVMKLWPRAWSEGGTPELRDRLGQCTNIHCGTQWRELNEVAKFLRTVEPRIGPRELNCWHDSTHPLYLMLDLDPATRYMHYGTAFGIKEPATLAPGERSKRQQIADAVRQSDQKYVVSDLLRTSWVSAAPYQASSWRNGDPLPVWLPEAERQKFPWNQPVVFRSGRYVVHKIENPLGTIRVPDWEHLNRLATLGPDE